MKTFSRAHCFFAQGSQSVRREKKVRKIFWMEKVNRNNRKRIPAPGRFPSARAEHHRNRIISTTERTVHFSSCSLRSICRSNYFWFRAGGIAGRIVLLRNTIHAQVHLILIARSRQMVNNKHRNTFCCTLRWWCQKKRKFSIKKNHQIKWAGRVTQPLMDGDINWERKAEDHLFFLWWIDPSSCCVPVCRLICWCWWKCPKKIFRMDDFS